MSRSIDTDALIMAIPDTSADVFENCRNCKLLDKEQIIDIINNAPTIEAEPVRHGHWEAHDMSIKDVPVEACSICGRWSYGYCERYCPKCGAKMDEVDE